MTDLDDTLTAFFGSDADDRTVTALVGYLDTAGILVFIAGAPFDWFYARLLRPLISELVASHGFAGQLAQAATCTLASANPAGGGRRCTTCRSSRRQKVRSKLAIPGTGNAKNKAAGFPAGRVSGESRRPAVTVVNAAGRRIGAPCDGAAAIAGSWPRHTDVVARGARRPRV
jgi:hypothetical protein